MDYSKLKAVGFYNGYIPGLKLDSTFTTPKHAKNFHSWYFALGDTAKNLAYQKTLLANLAVLKGKYGENIPRTKEVSQWIENY